MFSGKHRLFLFSVIVLFVVFMFAQTGHADLIEFGQHDDMTTNNPWTYWGPDAEVWNGYPTAGLYPALHSTASPTFQVVPSMTKDLFDGDELELIDVDEVYPEGIPEDREDDFTVGDELVDELFYVDFELHEFIEWSDGEPVTAHDVEFTHNITLEFGPVELGGNHPSFTPPDVIARVEALDDYTIRFYIIREDARFMFQALTRSIVPKHYWEPLIDEFMEEEDPIRALFGYEDTLDEPSAGPFMRGEWERGAYIDRDVNPNYSWKGSKNIFYDDGTYQLYFAEQGINELYYGYGDGEVVHEVEVGPFVDDGILYNVYADQASSVLALSHGDIEYNFNPLGLEVGFQEQLEGEEGVEMISNPAYGIRFMAFNLRKEPYNDKAFRQAVSALIDREFITDQVLQGVAFPLATVMPPGNAAWHNPDVPVPGEDMSRAERVEEAVEILKDAGYTWDQEPEVDHNADVVSVHGSGLRKPDGELVEEFDMLSPGTGYDPLRGTFAMFIERWAQEIGIPLQARMMDFSLIMERVFDEQDFEAFMAGWSLGSPAFPTFFHSFFHSSMTGLGGFNPQGFEDPEYDAYVEEFLSTLDIMEAQEIAHELQEILAEELPYIVLFDTDIVEAYRSDRLEFPYTEVLGGLQFVDGVPGSVSLID